MHIIRRVGRSESVNRRTDNTIMQSIKAAKEEQKICFLCPGHLPTYSVTHVRNSEIKQLSPLFFAMFEQRIIIPCFWDVDFIFGIWVYNDKLQIKLTFRSGPMIFGRVMVLGLWNLAKYLVVTTFFGYELRYWFDFWHENV
jgi:hypothetical protein